MESPSNLTQPTTTATSETPGNTFVTLNLVQEAMLLGIGKDNSLVYDFQEMIFQGCALMELAFKGRIGLEISKRFLDTIAKVIVLNQEPTGDPIVDLIFDHMKTEKRLQTPSDISKYITSNWKNSHGKDIQRLTRESLIDDKKLGEFEKHKIRRSKYFLNEEGLKLREDIQNRVKDIILKYISIYEENPKIKMPEATEKLEQQISNQDLDRFERDLALVNMCCFSSISKTLFQDDKKLKSSCSKIFKKLQTSANKKTNQDPDKTPIKNETAEQVSKEVTKSVTAAINAAILITIMASSGAAASAGCS